MQPVKGRRLLFIAHEFPPSAGGGVQRLSKYARYLKDLGWDVQMLAADPIPGRPRDTTLLEQVAGVPVARRPARHISAVIAALLRPLKRFKRVTPGSVAVRASSGGVPGGSERQRPLSGRIARWMAVPDDAVLWARGLPRLIMRMHRQAPFSAILASGPPYSALVAAVRAGAQLDLPVVADLRDPWSGNLHAKWPTAWHQRRFHALEREVMTKVAAVTAVSEVIADEAREYGASQVTVIPNGFDAAEMPAWAPDPTTPLRIAFLGQFSPKVADPAGFFAGLAAARETEPLLAGVRVDIIGASAPWTSVAVHDAGLDDVVTFHGFKPYQEALRMVSAADAGLIVLADIPGAKGVYSGKLFDYLGIGIPVFLYGPPEGAAADLLGAAGCGVVVPYGNPSAVTAEIVRMARMKASGEPLCRPVDAVRARYDRREQVNVLSGILEDVILRSHTG